MNIKDSTHNKRESAVYYWLLTTAFFVFAMAVIGAITRLTESGLSMVEWRPFIGTLPPLNEPEWLRVFGLYQETAEYQHKNFGMSLGEFKHIFFWEWFHRFWGRLIGLVYALPFFYFLIKGTFTRIWIIRFTILLILGASQAVMGWYMVMSGLADIPDVSHYRLAAHLSLAALILVFLIYYACLYKGINSTIQKTSSKNGHIGLLLLFITLIWGAFVAGTDSGLIYNTFPKMGDQWLPSELLDLSPIWLNILENHAAIQFTHRILAIITVIYVLNFSFTHWKESIVFKVLASLITIQLMLGISTLLSQVWIPLAALHQAVAFLLIGSMTFIIQQQKKRK